MKYILEKISLILLLLLHFINGSSKINTDTLNNSIDIYIVKHEWHTGLVVNRASAERYLPSLKNEFNNYNFIEIGWGDKDFYMAEKETLWLGFKAAVWPTESVLHFVAFNTNPELYYANSEIISLVLTDYELKKLLNYIEESLYKDDNNNIVLVSSKLNKASRFYLSKEKYHIFKTCNVWVAKALKEAGISIRPIYALTSGNVIKQLKKKN